MLRSIKDLENYKIIVAKEEEIGKIYDLFFDDNKWIIRYFAVDTGNWLPGKRVLLSPYSLGEPVWSDKVFHVTLTKKQLEESPDIDTHKPVERQKELELVQYYGWPNYWSGLGSPVVGAYIPASPMPVTHTETEEDVDVHLHSSKSIIDYNIEASDESIGHVEDFILDDSDWSIRYLVVDTHNWLPGGKKVIVSPHWIKRMDWVESRVYVDLTKEQIKNSPEWNDLEPLTRGYEAKLHEHYGRKIYW